MQPLHNLTKAFEVTLKNKGDPLSALREILSFPKDDHGNIRLGIDGNDFQLWGKIKSLIPFKVFGPIIIVTDKSVINSVLMHLKNEPEGFNGNQSADLIGVLAGVNNIFAATNPDVHTIHKANFKDFLNDPLINIKRIAPIIAEWVQQQICVHGKIDDKNLEQLCAKILICFLLDEVTAHDQSVIDAVIYMKSHFIHLAGMKKLIRRDATYNEKQALINERIDDIILDKDSFSSFLFNKKNYSSAEVKSEICSLLMVGFDNLRSVLASLLVNMATQPESRDKLKAEIIEFDHVPFISFDPYFKKVNHSNEAGQRFFKETTRLVPPVWLQARKNGEQAVTISYQDDQGETLTFLVPARTTILIPAYHLARELENGETFDAEREQTSSLPLPFSTGPNACPGRNIAYTAAGLLLANIIKNDIHLQQINPTKLSPHVSLTLENLNLRMISAVKHHDSTTYVTPMRHGNLFNSIWTQLPRISLTSAVSGVASVLAYYETESLLVACGGGVLSATLLWEFLQRRGENEMKVDESPRFSR